MQMADNDNDYENTSDGATADSALVDPLVQLVDVACVDSYETSRAWCKETTNSACEFGCVCLGPPASHDIHQHVPQGHGMK